MYKHHPHANVCNSTNVKTKGKHLLLSLLIPIILFFPVKPAADAVFKQLEPLAGTWKMQAGKKTIYESWKKVNDHEMHGMSYKLSGTDTTIFEQVKLLQKDNAINYIATVKGQNNGQGVAFTLTTSANNTFIFENPAHDFPQRVAYQFISRDSIHAWIDGKNNGKELKEDYYYSRVK